MSSSAVDSLQQRLPINPSSDLVDFIVHHYDDQAFEEQWFSSVGSLLDLLKDRTIMDKPCWIEVINRSDVELPESITTFCEYFEIHPLTIEDIITLAPGVKLDLFNEQSLVYLLMKIISWNGKHVKQQQISFCLKCSQNILITFQERATDLEPLFDDIRNRLRRQRGSTDDASPYHQHTPLKQLNVDYLFYSLLDAIVDRYMNVLEEIAIRIDQIDTRLMVDQSSLSLETFYTIYRIKHDLLHLRILFNPLTEIVTRLRRTTQDERFHFRRIDRPHRLDLKHRLVRRQNKKFLLSSEPSHTPVDTARENASRFLPKVTKSSVVFNEHVYIYLNDLMDHINQLIDTVEIQRESVAMLSSFWLTLNNNETQAILKFLMLISVLFMPGILLTGMHATNFNVQPQYQYKYGYYILLTVMAMILSSMIAWYKVKRWI